MDRLVIIRRLMQIALPILASSLISLFAIFINMATVGRAHPESLYVLGVVLPVTFLMNSINESLRVSAIAQAAQASGSGNTGLLARRLQSLLLLGLAVYGLLALLFWLGQGQFMEVYAVPAAQRATTATFIQFSIFNNALLVVSTCMMASLYGLNQVYRVTAISIVSFSANVLLTWALVRWAGTGLYSLVLATLITASTTAGWAAARLRRLGVLRWPGRDLRAALLADWRVIYGISAPVFAGYLILFANSLLFNRLLAQFSPADIAGFGVANRLQNIVLMPAITIGIALAIHVNRMAAAHEREQIYAYISTALWACFGLFAALAGLVYLGRDLLAGLVTHDRAVVASASHYLGYLGPAYALIGPLLTLLVFQEETGNGLRSLLFNAGSLAIQLGLAFYVAQTYRSLDLVYQTVALSYLASALYILFELARSRRLLAAQSPTFIRARG